MHGKGGRFLSIGVHQLFPCSLNQNVNILHFLCAGLETNLVDSTDLFTFTSDDTWTGIFFILLNRDTQILNEKTNWFWHLWPYCNLELGHADLRSSMHKRHPKTKIFAPQIEKTDASALGDFCSNYVKDVFAALPLYCKGKQWDCELFLIVTFPYCFFFSGIHVQRFQCWHLTFTHSIWTTQRCLFHGLRILN